MTDRHNTARRNIARAFAVGTGMLASGCASSLVGDPDAVSRFALSSVAGHGPNQEKINDDTRKCNAAAVASSPIDVNGVQKYVAVGGLSGSPTGALTGTENVGGGAGAVTGAIGGFFNGLNATTQDAQNEVAREADGQAVDKYECFLTLHYHQGGLAYSGYGYEVTGPSDVGAAGLQLYQSTRPYAAEKRRRAKPPSDQAHVS